MTIISPMGSPTERYWIIFYFRLSKRSDFVTHVFQKVLLALVSELFKVVCQTKEEKLRANVSFPSSQKPSGTILLFEYTKRTLRPVLNGIYEDVFRAQK